jgi:hypothetical protein
LLTDFSFLRKRIARTAAQQADHQQLGAIDLECYLAAYLVRRIGSGQRCVLQLKPDPLAGAKA